MIGGRTDRFVIEVITCDCGREADEVRVAMIDQRGEPPQILAGVMDTSPESGAM